MLKDIKDHYRPLIIVIVAFIGLSIYYDLGYWLVQKPGSVHVWRQTDCASYALNYYQNDRSFFSPQVHHRHAIDGSTASEFPIIYYIAAKLYNVFGFHDFYIRWINYFIFFCGLLAVTLTSTYFIKNKLLASFPAILLMMSCVIVYYGSNYLPDVPALSFALIGFYFFIRYTTLYKNTDFAFAIFFSVMASLLKISSALLFVCIMLYTLYQRFISKNERYNNINFLIIILGLLTVGSWVYYVKIYNEQGQYFGNLQGTMGIWLCDKDKILYIIKRTFEEWIPALGSRKLWLLFVPVMIYIGYHWKKLISTLQFILPVLLAGCIFYLIAWFAVFDVHDYYFINVFVFPVLLAIAFFSTVEQTLSPKQLKIFIITALILFVMTAEDTEAQFYNRKYHSGWNSSPPKGFYNIEPYLRSLGIDRHQLIYSPSDASTNITLYFANNPGWTKLFDTKAESAIARGASYMLLENAQLESPEFNMYKDKKIGEFEGISIVKF